MVVCRQGSRVVVEGVWCGWGGGCDCEFSLGRTAGCDLLQRELQLMPACCGMCARVCMCGLRTRDLAASA